MSAVSDQFFGDNDEAGGADDASARNDDKAGNGDSAKAGDQATKTAETKGDTSKAEEPPTSGAGKDKGQSKKQHHVPLEALEAERQKRQEAERERDEARGKRNSAGGEGTTEQPKKLTKDDALVDPGTYADQKADEVKGDVQKLRQEFQARHYNASEKRARAATVDKDGKPDEEAFKKYYDGFLEAANADKRLFAQMDADDDPVVWAIQKGRQYLKAKEMGDPEDFEAKIRADERAKIEAEQKRKEPLAKAKDIPPSNAGARGAADVDATGDAGDEDDDESFNSILGRRKRRGRR